MMKSFLFLIYIPILILVAMITFSLHAQVRYGLLPAPVSHIPEI